MQKVNGKPDIPSDSLRISLRNWGNDEEVPYFNIYDNGWPPHLSVLFNNPEFSDLTLVLTDPTAQETKKFYCHKAILSGCSDFFRGMFVRGMKESKLQEIEIKEVDPTIFGLLLQFLYQGNITVEPDQILSLITLADEYQIRHLIEKCLEVLKNLITIENCCSLWIASQYFSSYVSSKQLKEACYTTILENFSDICKCSEFLDLDFSSLKTILQEDLLEGKEDDFFFAAMKWIEHNLDTRITYLDEILNLIRFPLISGPVLVQIDQHKIASRSANYKEILFDAMKFSTDPNSFAECTDKRYQQRIGFKVIELPYITDYETGVIAYLRKRVEVASSSQWRGEPQDFISDEKVFCWTKNEPFSWFAVDLGSGKSFLPTHYTMAYGSSGNNVPPRNWLLQATNKPSAFKSKKLPQHDPEWLTLSVHENDCNIDTEHGYYTWKLDLPQSKKQFYRFFRIIQTGKNKQPFNLEWNEVLVASGFELYGTLRAKHSPKSAKKTPAIPTPKLDPNYDQKSFPYQEDSDQQASGIIRWLVSKDPYAVQVQASSISRGQKEEFIAPEKVFVWTKNEPFSWFGVDFGEGRGVLPTHYTMAYGSSGNNVPPRNWLLQASNKSNAFQLKSPDDKDWITLMTHRDDRSINSSHGSFTWALNYPKEKQTFYRFFRIIQVGKNKMPTNAEWGDVLVASGFELFGYFREKSATANVNGIWAKLTHKFKS